VTPFSLVEVCRLLEKRTVSIFRDESKQSNQQKQAENFTFLQNISLNRFFFSPTLHNLFAFGFKPKFCMQFFHDPVPSTSHMFDLLPKVTVILQRCFNGSG
jgi:hypothetical protein